jgi:hypothetical protein
LAVGLFAWNVNAVAAWIWLITVSIVATLTMEVNMTIHVDLVLNFVLEMEMSAVAWDLVVDKSTLAAASLEMRIAG